MYGDLYCTNFTYLTYAFTLSVKSMAADQIKRACQNYWAALSPPGPSPCYGTVNKDRKDQGDCHHLLQM